MVEIVRRRDGERRARDQAGQPAAVEQMVGDSCVIGLLVLSRHPVAAGDEQRNDRYDDCLDICSPTIVAISNLSLTLGFRWLVTGHCTYRFLCYAVYSSDLAIGVPARLVALGEVRFKTEVGGSFIIGFLRVVIGSRAGLTGELACGRLITPYKHQAGFNAAFQSPAITAACRTGPAWFSYLSCHCT